LKITVGAATLPFVTGFEKASNPTPTLTERVTSLTLELSEIGSLNYRRVP